MNYLIFIIIFWMLYALYFWYKYDKISFIQENWMLIKFYAMKNDSELFRRIELLEGRDYE